MRRFLTGEYKPGMSGLNLPPPAHGLAAAVPTAPPRLEPPGGSRKETGLARHFLPAFPFSFPDLSRSAFAVKDTGLDRSPCKGTAEACFPPPFALLPDGQSLALRPRIAPLQASLKVQSGHFITATASRDGESPSKGRRQKKVTL